MKRLRNAPIGDVNVGPAKLPFKVLIAYEDFRLGQHAKRLFDGLENCLAADYRLDICEWKFDVLRFTRLQEMAAEDAADSHLIVISAHAANELPPWVKAWIERWLPARHDKSGALVALLEPADDLDPGASILQLYLQTIARRAQLDFFPFICLLPGFGFDYSTEEIIAAVKKTMPMIARLFPPSLPSRADHDPDGALGPGQAKGRRLTKAA
jgi:hypothetical protein